MIHNKNFYNIAVIAFDITIIGGLASFPALSEQQQAHS